MANRYTMNWWLAKAKHIDEVEDVAKEFKDRFGALPRPVENPLYMVRIEILTMRAKVGSISTQGKQVVIKPLETFIESGAKQSLSRGYDGAVKIGATQIKLARKLLGDRWMEILREILSCRNMA